MLSGKIFCLCRDSNPANFFSFIAQAAVAFAAFAAMAAMAAIAAIAVIAAVAAIAAIAVIAAIAAVAAAAGTAAATGMGAAVCWFLWVFYKKFEAEATSTLISGLKFNHLIWDFETLLLRHATYFFTE